MKRILPLVAIVLSLLLWSSTASLARPSTVRSIPPPDPVTSAAADSLRVVNFYGAQAVAEYLAGVQAADDARAAEEARVAALRAAQVATARVPAVTVPQTGSDWDRFAACVIAHESGGNPQAANPNSSASGLFQDLDSTWAGYGGYSRAMYAPVEVQYARNFELWAGGAGAGHWAGSGC